jgi:type II secretory pathway pseudopilin PulG
LDRDLATRAREAQAAAQAARSLLEQVRAQMGTALPLLVAGAFADRKRAARTDGALEAAMAGAAPTAAGHKRSAESVGLHAMDDAMEGAGAVASKRPRLATMPDAAPAAGSMDSGLALGLQISSEVMRDISDALTDQAPLLDAALEAAKDTLMVLETYGSKGPSNLEKVLKQTGSQAAPATGARRGRR